MLRNSIPRIPIFLVCGAYFSGLPQHSYKWKRTAQECLLLFGLQSIKHQTTFGGVVSNCQELLQLQKHSPDTKHDKPNLRRVWGGLVHHIVGIASASVVPAVDPFPLRQGQNRCDKGLAIGADGSSYRRVWLKYSSEQYGAAQVILWKTSSTCSSIRGPIDL